MRDEVRAVEAFFHRRYGRPALYLPSGRLALYVAFQEWLRPGDRLLMSPVNDDVVFFTVLAAGLVPVLAPVDPGTGNIDAAAVPEAVWPGLRAVMTTNLYGIPDRMDVLLDRCRRHDILLLEDAAHAIDTRFDGRRIGDFGPVAAFSLSKHVGGAGGVLTFSEPGRRDSLAHRAEQAIVRQSPPGAMAYQARALVRTVAAGTRLRRWVGGLRDRFGPPPERAGHRMPYDPAQVRRAQQAGGGLDRFEQWVRVDNHQYRTWPSRASLRRTLRRLQGLEATHHLRLAGARRLLELHLTPPDLPVPPDTALFRVPLFVRARETIRIHFAARGVAADYIYDPPLDLYAPGLAERLGSPPSATAWSRDVLPVDPLLAERFVTVLASAPGLCQPAVEPLPAGDRRGPAVSSPGVFPARR